MIISHRHKFIFFAVPKTATHAIREALRRHCGPDDWEQQVLFGEQFLPIPKIAKIGHGHISVRDIRLQLEPGIWKGYFKFAVVRNPFDRFVSSCFFLNRDKANFADEAAAFMKERLPRQRFQQRVLVRPQHRQLCTLDNQLAMDFVGRYENLQESYDTICDRLGLPRSTLDRKNESQHSKYDSYYDDELRQLVREFYKDDFRIFDYNN